MNSSDSASLLNRSFIRDSNPAPLKAIPPPTYGVDMRRLIGKPHLFGRVRHLREGLLIEPIGVLTLQTEGRITGYDHQNESSWIPYIHGPVSGTNAFAFVTAQNNWIPSSTWTQSMGDIPIGYFCDEPEVGQSAQQMCLIPNDPLPSHTVIFYVIASCLRFYERTVPVLLEQLFAEGIRPPQIKVVVNGCSHSSPGFRRSVEAVNGHIKWDHLPASSMARCLLGLYSHDFLMRCNGWLESIDHIDKKNGVIAEAGGELLLRARSVFIIGDPDANGQARAAEWRDTTDQFNTGASRVRRVFPSVKVHKFIHTGSTNPTSL